MMGLNLLFVAMKLFFGVYYRSFWFGTLGVYYIMLAFMRFMLLNHVNRVGIGTEILPEWRNYRICGGMLVLMTIALSGMVILVVRKNESYNYAGYLIYVVAMYAFYNIISTVRDVIKFKRYHSPVMSASKFIKLASALVSMLALETAMLMQFDVDKNPESFRRNMTAATEGTVCVIVLILAAYMIVHSTREIRKLRNSPKEGRVLRF
uniref:Uncharacterized protein n=1 Tax=uncultured bacterium scaffold00090 TaxID=1132476 RepID=I7AVE7_9BACT|nr:hypothetical protein [uncultured bacterium scaffold00090]